MFEIISAEQMNEFCRGKIENYFNNHPEYDELLRKLDKVLTCNALMIKRTNGTLFIFNDERPDVDGEYALAKFVKPKIVPVERITNRKRIPVYKKGRFGKEVVDHFDEEVTKEVVNEQQYDSDEIEKLGKFIVIYLKYLGYKITNAKYGPYFYDSDGHMKGGGHHEFLESLAIDF